MNEYVSRALAGCEFLDAHFGNRDWRDRLDVNKLYVGDRLNCIIGQLFLDAEEIDPLGILPAYIEAQQELGIAGDAPRNAALGFDLAGEELDGKNHDHEYDQLTIAWQHALSV